MKNKSENSRRSFIRNSALAAAASLGALSLDWKTLSAHGVSKKPFPGPKPYGPPISHLPLQLFGFNAIPAVPYVIEDVPDTLERLGFRSYEVLQAKNGLSNTFTINGTIATGSSYMYGRNGESSVAADDRAALTAQFANTDMDALLGSSQVKDLLINADRKTVTLSTDPITGFSLDDPKQFALSWTNFYNVYQKASAAYLTSWADSISDVNAATKAFWPTIAKYGLAYNLLIISKVNTQTLSEIKQGLGSGLKNFEDLADLASSGNLYAIDLTIFKFLAPQTVEGAPRFTPATLVLLQQDSITKELTPFTIVVTGQDGTSLQTYLKGVCTDGAWLYALQAAKVAVTVYGIWIGHVYHWHIVTASMVMTMYNSIPSSHPLYPMLDYQSQFLITFNEVLLLLWRSIAPPSSITSGWQLIEFLNQFATGRNYFDDDPIETMNNQGIDQSDFTVNQPWDAFPIAGTLLDIWNKTNTYVTAVVNKVYATDQDVANDNAIQVWMNVASDPGQGNINGLPTVNSKATLIHVLTSFFYRLSAHGCSRLINSANPSLTFVGNFPPCLQRTNIPPPNTAISTQDLMKYLPKTGTIGEMINFYFIFSFSAPYDSMIPVQGVDQNLPYPNGANDARNAALIQFRKDISATMDQLATATQTPGFTNDTPQYQQWPSNIET